MRDRQPGAKIHVHRPNLSRNGQDGGNRPVCVVDYGKNVIKFASEVIINGPSKVVYKPDHKGSAQVWIETDAQLILIGEVDG